MRRCGWRGTEAVAALLAPVMGMGASEIVSRVVRDLDDGNLLWIPDSKTEAGRRTLQVPELLRPFLKALAARKSPEAKLFGHHWRDWVRKWVPQICEAAGVPKVTAHGMRGLNSTLAVEHGEFETNRKLLAQEPRQTRPRPPAA